MNARAASNVRNVIAVSEGVSKPQIIFEAIETLLTITFDSDPKGRHTGDDNKPSI
jgi:hypothetical protein